MEHNITHFGISTALLTPFHSNGALNIPLFCEHATGTMTNGADGVTLFGTTGEGASIGLDERPAAISGMLNAGIDADAMTLGLFATAIHDVISQVDQGLSFGITRFLLMPPFYFKNLDDAGLRKWHAQLFDAVDSRAKFILYHIPQVSHVPLSFELITQIAADFPDRVLAIKDSAGEWEPTKRLLEKSGVPILVGDERLLHKAAALGGAGSICGMANLYPQRLKDLYQSHTEDAELSSEVDLIVSVPVIPALKQVMALRTGNESWVHLRAPLQPLSGTARKSIVDWFSAP